MKTKNYFKLLTFMFLIVSSISPISCGDNGNNQIIENLNNKIDSLENENAMSQTELREFNLFIATLSDGLDSIAKQESLLFYTNKGREQTIIDRKQLKKNLEAFASILQEQRQRITQLTDSLKMRGTNISKLNNIVNYLNLQIDEKDRLIKQMQADLNKKSMNITQLKERIYTLAEDNSELTKEVDNQKQTLSTKDDIINGAYVMIGTKKELKDLGLLSGGFLKKQKVNYQNLSNDKFEKVDIRTYREIHISSKKVKILTPMPSSSYEIKTDDDKTLLHIIEPTAFWSVSSYLIIQTN